MTGNPQVISRDRVINILCRPNIQNVSFGSREPFPTARSATHVPEAPCTNRCTTFVPSRFLAVGWHGDTLKCAGAGAVAVLIATMDTKSSRRAFLKGAAVAGAVYASDSRRFARSHHYRGFRDDHRFRVPEIGSREFQ
jgi:hypothetical protein